MFQKHQHAPRPICQLHRNGMLALAMSAATVSFGPSVGFADDEWANWRGPLGTGASLDASPPKTWGPDKNIEWKVEMEGLGSSTPIVWEDQVLVLSAVKTDKPAPADEDAGSGAANRRENPDPNRPAEGRPGGRPGDGDRRPGGPEGRGPGGRGPGGRPGGGMSGPKPTTLHQFLIHSYSLKTGKENWKSVITEAVPHEGGHSTNNFASSSPVTDGKHIYVFLGSRGIYCLDMSGKKVWATNLGKQKTRNEFGEGSSAALYKDSLIVPWDHEGESFVAALDANTGEVKWKTPRNEKTTWATPLVVEHKGVTQVITNGRTVRSYDLKDGSLIWECAGQTENPIPSPFIYKDWVIATTGFRGAACFAISLDAQGEVKSDSKYVKWTYNQNTPYVPSPTLYKDQLYFVSENKAILSSVNIETGKPVFARERINGLDTVYSSIGAAADKIYVTGRNGTTVVLKAGAEKEVLATNELGEEIDASPVFVGDRLLLRSNKHLFSIKE